MVFYDADCAFCTRLAARLEKALQQRGFSLAPLQSELARDRLGLREGASFSEMRLLSRDGENLGGGDAVIFLARRIWWAWPVWALAQLPGMRGLLRAGYRRIAARRSCAGGHCKSPQPSKWPGWIVLLLFLAVIVPMRDALPPWAFMWLLAGAIFFGCKWLTFRRAKPRAGRIGPLRALGYLFAWPGMDAARFLRAARVAHEDGGHNFTIPAVGSACARATLGAVLLWGAARRVPEPLLAGWIGMLGLILLLHFGAFQLLALAWRRLGIDAPPIMDAPMRSASLGEFWGRRWNGAFNRLASDFVFRPVAKKLGTTVATLSAFGLSGFIHELVISVPARGGYGLPLAYFLVQGLGVLAEHTRAGCRLGLGRGVRGWLLTMFVTAAPAFWLFHPPFVRRVIVPFLQTIHAL